jgi:IS5 family transposase
MATIQSRAAAAKGARQQTPSDGDDLSVQIANLQRELAEARAALGEREKESTSWRTKAEQAEARYTTEKLRSSLHSAAAKANAIDPDDVVELVINRGARIDGDRVVFGQGAEAKPADEYIAAMLASKPHMVRAAAVAQGSGAPATQAVSAPAAAPQVKHDLKTREGATAAVGGALLQIATKNAKGA